MDSDVSTMADRWARHPDHPVVDAESAAVLEEAVHSLTVLRSAGYEGDAGARLHMLASLMAQAEAVLGDTVADARDQDYSWAEIAERLGIACHRPTPLRPHRRHEGGALRGLIRTPPAN